MDSVNVDYGHSKLADDPQLSLFGWEAEQIGGPCLSSLLESFQETQPNESLPAELKARTGLSLHNDAD